MSARHLHAGARLLFSTGLSPILEHEAICTDKEQAGPALTGAKLSQPLTCPRCFMIWIPGITCRVRAHKSKSNSNIESLRNKNKRARERLRNRMGQRRDAFEKRVGRRLGTKFTERPASGSCYLHYDCLCCVAHITVPASPPTESTGAKTDTQRKHELQSEPLKNEKDKDKSKNAGKLVRLNLNDFLL